MNSDEWSLIPSLWNCFISVVGTQWGDWALRSSVEPWDIWTEPIPRCVGNISRALEQWGWLAFELSTHAYESHLISLLLCCSTIRHRRLMILKHPMKHRRDNIQHLNWSSLYHHKDKARYRAGWAAFSQFSSGERFDDSESSDGRRKHL